MTKLPGLLLRGSTSCVLTARAVVKGYPFVLTARAVVKGFPFVLTARAVVKGFHEL